MKESSRYVLEKDSPSKRLHLEISTLGTQLMHKILLVSWSTEKNMADVLGLRDLYCFMAASKACDQYIRKTVPYNTWKSFQFSKQSCRSMN